MSLDERFAALRDRHWPAMQSLIDARVARTVRSASSLSEMCSYHLATGGKRIRAVLPLLTAEALGHDPAAIVPFGAACEILHNATLVHDDLQDGDTVRRGRDTVWRRFGAPQAINLGDAMFYYAVLLLTDWPGEARRRERAIELLLTETLHVIDGQEREFAMRAAPSPSLAEYVAMVEGKTSGLFRLPMQGAAILCGAEESVVDAIGVAARHLGVLFQIQDDLVDIFGDKGRGQVGSDIAEGKRSILVVHALAHAPLSHADELLEILDKPRAQTTDDDRARAIELFERTGAVAEARQELTRRREASVGAVRDLGNPRLLELVEGLGGLLDGASSSLESPRALASSLAQASEDLAFCRAILPKVSRTFALSIATLPPTLESAVLSAYLLCRIVDTIEDAPTLPLVERERLFDSFAGLLAEDLSDPRAFEELSTAAGFIGDDPEPELCRRAGSVLRLFRSLPQAQRRAIRPRVLVMLDGMRAYCRRQESDGRLRLADVEDLERYCYYVAGTVGRLLTDLFLELCPDLSADARALVTRNAVSFGVGLQLVNIVKDVAEDLERGVCYLPLELAKAHGIDLEELLAPEHRQAGLAILREVCSRARHHLDLARAYCLAWPVGSGAPVRLFCGVPLALALATLSIVESGEDALTPGRSPKVSRARVAQILSEASRAASDDALMTELFADTAAHVEGSPPPKATLRTSTRRP